MYEYQIKARGATTLSSFLLLVSAKAIRRMEIAYAHFS